MTKPVKIALGIGVAAVVSGALTVVGGGVPRLLAAWTTLACVIACLGYLTNQPHWIGKRDGTVSMRALAVLPYLVAFRIACRGMARWRGPDAPTRVATGLWVGGRVTAATLPPGIDMVVDLVAEYSADPAVRALPGYRSLPVLDGGVPADVEAFLVLVAEAAMPGREVLVHCDSGRGRAPTFAAAVLVARGIATGVMQAVTALQAQRPVAAPTRSDLEFLAGVTPRLRAIAVDREQPVG